MHSAKPAAAPGSEPTLHYTKFMPDPYAPPPHIYFSDSMVAGLTPIERGKPFDRPINRPHGMQGYIINLTVKGGGLIQDGSSSFTCRAGDLLLFPPHVPHLYRLAPDEDCWYHQWVYFFARPYWQEALQWPCPVFQVGLFQLPPENFAEFTQAFSEIISRSGADGSCAKILQLNYLEQILMRRLELSAGEKRTLPDSRVSTAQLFIKQHLAEPELGLAEIAAQVLLSKSQLSALFKQYSGVSPLRWRDQERVRQAQFLLSNTTLKIEDIGLKIGIPDSSYFFRFFKKHCGRTPAQFRREAAALQQLHETAPTAG